MGSQSLDLYYLRFYFCVLFARASILSYMAVYTWTTLEATERFQESEGLQAVFSRGSLRGATSTRLGSGSSRIFDNGRVLVAQGGSLAVT